jgi:phosphoglycolate phosphatase
MIDLSVYRHILWDWNGTLINDVPQCVAVLNDMLARRGMEAITLERYRQLLRFPVRQFYEDLGFGFVEETYEAVADEYIAGYDREWPHCTLQPGARELVMLISQAEMGQSVLSAYQQQRLEEAVRYFGLGDFFERLVGLDDHYAHGKQASGVRYMKELALAGHEVLFIGDTVHDWEVAQAMGADCVLYSGGHKDAANLAACGVPVIESLGELAV